MHNSITTLYFFKFLVEFLRLTVTNIVVTSKLSNNKQFFYQTREETKTITRNHVCERTNVGPELQSNPQIYVPAQLKLMQVCASWHHRSSISTKAGATSSNHMTGIRYLSSTFLMDQNSFSILASNSSTHKLKCRWHIMQWMTLPISFHYLSSKRNLLANHKYKCPSLSSSTSGSSSNTTHIFTWITWEVKEYDMIHTSKVNST